MPSNITPSYEQQRCRLGEALPLDTPFTVIIDSSERCNFRCQYCFRSGSVSDTWGYCARQDLMEWDVFLRVCDQLKEFPKPLKRIAFSNHGEPLCNPRLSKMILYLKEQGVAGKTEIHTNASLLTPVSAKELAQCGIDKIVVSLQGMTAEKYRQVCGVNINYQKFYECLQILYKEKTNTQINIKIVDKALDEGEEHLFYERFSPIADHVFVEKIVPLFKGVDYSGMTETEKETHYNKYSQSFAIQECCPQLFYTLVVTPCGDLYPCAQMDAPFCLGNIRGISLSEAWNSSQRTDFLRLHLQKGRGIIPQCQNCYIPQNTVKVDKDVIDPYRNEILRRMEKK